VSPDVQTVEQAREAFSSAGYTVDQAHSWDWASPPFSSFQVQDPARDRVLMVLVYPSITAAQTARVQAAAHDPTQDGASAEASDVSPHLAVGYGMSTWSGNVALVQTTGSDLRRLYQTQIDQDNDLYIDPDLALAPNQTGLAVDSDFLQALQNGVVNL
jgi:hypothetical protein